MKTMDNLIYTIQADYINNFGENVSICKKIYSSGLELNSVQVEDTCITEKTINGRILSGKLTNNKFCCGYRYD